MAPSQMAVCEQVPNYEHVYKHKKFNCVYTHKKFGSRLAPRNAQGHVQQVQPTIPLSNDDDTKHSSKETSELFRPYALNADTPRKRKGKQCESQLKATAQSTGIVERRGAQTHYDIYKPALDIKCQAESMAFCKQNYTLILQKQTQALYMRQMLELQGYGVGNNWNSHVSY